MCLQAVCYSLLNNSIQCKVREGKGCSPGDLQPVVSWFSKSISVSVSEETIRQVNPTRSSPSHAVVKSRSCPLSTCVDVQRKARASCF